MDIIFRGRLTQKKTRKLLDIDVADRSSVKTAAKTFLVGVYWSTSPRKSRKSVRDISTVSRLAKRSAKLASVVSASTRGSIK